MAVLSRISWNVDRVRLIRNRRENLLAHPERRIGHEARAVFRAVVADRLEKPHAPLRDHILERQAAAAKFLRDVYDVREIRRNQKIDGLAIAVAGTRDLLVLLGAFLSRPSGDLPEAERAAHEVLSLPLYPEMTIGQLDRVADALADALRR